VHDRPAAAHLPVAVEGDERRAAEHRADRQGSAQRPGDGHGAEDGRVDGDRPAGDRRGVEGRDHGRRQLRDAGLAGVEGQRLEFGGQLGRGPFVTAGRPALRQGGGRSAQPRRRQTPDQRGDDGAQFGIVVRPRRIPQLPGQGPQHGGERAGPVAGDAALVALRALAQRQVPGHVAHATYLTHRA
jgi:hypothetical protein